MADTAEYGTARNGSRTIRAKASRSRRSEGATARRVATTLLLGIVPLAAAAILLVFPATRISRYEISGDTVLGREEILRWAAVHGTEYLATVDCERMSANIEAHPQVEKAQVERVFPNGLRIIVTDRVPVAAVLANVEGRMVPVAVDRDGVAFRQLSEAADVPVLSGIRFEGFRYGVRLPENLHPVLKSLAELRQGDAALLSAFSEIRIVRRQYGELELMLYPLHYRVPVRTPTVLNEAMLRSIILVLDVVERQGLSSGISELDFRTGTVVYRVKEGVSG